ncbi:MAG: hypothetical protein NTY09_00935 [bacterium]|nr:hypothetical protein [bacterium]
MYIDEYHIYQYTFLDDLSFSKKPEDVYKDGSDLKDEIHRVSNAFLQAGWEGDGEICVIWVPPFVDLGIEDTLGRYLWHVKQKNNGISFIASDRPLEYGPLTQHNWNIEILKYKACSITEDASERLKGKTSAILQELDQSLDHLNENGSDPIANNISCSLLIHTQGLLIGALQEYLDQCYLQLLLAAVHSGSKSKIKLKCTKVKLREVFYMPNNEDDEFADDPRFKLQLLVSDIWLTYKRESFPEKIDKLFKAVDYALSSEVKGDIKKHVFLRNCVHHHGAKIDKREFDSAGLSSITIKQSNGNLTLLPWDRINFTREEIHHLCELLFNLADSFNKHCEKNIPAKYFTVNVDHESK